jgi:hypothetical protein
MAFNRISALPWYINGRVFRKKTFKRFQMTLLDLLIPVAKKIDQILPWPSLSLIGVFEKK